MRALPLICVLFAGCLESAPEPDIDEVEVAAEDDGKSDGATELRVRTGETSVWMTRDLTRRETPDGAIFVLRGRASRNVTDGSGFVFDDPYGDFATRSARTFEVSWPVSTARSLVDGVNQFVRLHFTPSAGRPDTLTARVVVRPRLGGFEGSSSVYLTAELTPVVHGGVVTYRVRGRTAVVATALAVELGGVVLSSGDVRIVDPTHFEIDIAPDHAFAIAGSGSAISIRATLDGQTVTKTARLGLAIKKLGITAEDAYEKWPRPTCTDTTRSCLTALPDGALDLAPCGEAIVVLACAGQVGVFTDDVALQAAIARAAATTSSSAFRGDATALVGAARLEEFAFAAQQTAEDRLQQLFGRWYLSATSRDAALAAATDSAILHAIARPLDLVEATPPVAGDIAVARHVAADALLVALASYDFESSEYARSYEALVAQFRARHVASLRAFRETVPLSPHPGNPGWDVLVGTWLDPYVEVSIDRATGAAANVLIEID